MHYARTGCRAIPTKNTRYRRMSRYRAGKGSNETGCTMHALAVGPARREMTLDRSVNHSDDQGSFHEVVGFRHLRNLSFCGLYGFLLLKCFRMAFSYV